MDDIPCHTPGQRPNRCALALQEFTVYGLGPLGGPWKGWRLAGRELVGPGGERFSAERLRGLAWRVDQEQRLAKLRKDNEAALESRRASPVKVVVVTLAEFQARRHGAA